MGAQFLPTRSSFDASDMVAIPGGEFAMGSDAHYPEEAPQHRGRVAPFRIDRHPVTNRQFSEFVRDTGYRTIAELPLSAEEYPQLSPEERAAGSLCFRQTTGPVDLRDWRQWWVWTAGAYWRRPFGEGSSIEGKDEHPVVQLCFADASAYAAWAGKRLPTEIEWERAAWGGTVDREYAWGTELHPDGRLMANTWQGSFPYRNIGAAGWVGTSPVGTFEPNGFGLFDLIGNVWEWTASPFTPDHRAVANSSVEMTTALASGGCGCGCAPADSGRTASIPGKPDSAVRRVTKGGSHLCAPEYCQRYRPAARSPQTEDSATSHLGFRCAADA